MNYLDVAYNMGKEAALKDLFKRTPEKPRKSTARKVVGGTLAGISGGALGGALGLLGGTILKPVAPRLAKLLAGKDGHLLSRALVTGTLLGAAGGAYVGS